MFFDVVNVEGNIDRAVFADELGGVGFYLQWVPNVAKANIDDPKTEV